MRPTQHDLDGLLDLLVAAVLREIENEEIDATAPGKERVASGELHGREDITPRRARRK